MKRENKGHFKRVFLKLKGVYLSYSFNGRQRGVVEFSETLHILLCEVKMVDFLDRRFCFEILSTQQNLLFQAESEDDYRDWIRCLELAKSYALKQESQPDLMTTYEIP